jgi:hypothetical protein
MNARELIARAQDLCSALGRPFPTEIKAYSWDWQRQRYDLGWCWGMLKCALRERRALWQIDVQVRRHHDQLQRHKDTRDLKAGEPLDTTPEPGLERWWDAESPQEDVQSSASVRNDLDGVGPCEKPRQTLRAGRQPYRKRTGTKTHKIRELLKAHVVRRGPASVRKLESMAKAEGLLEYDQAISRSSSFRRVMRGALRNPACSQSE